MNKKKCSIVAIAATRMRVVIGAAEQVTSVRVRPSLLTTVFLPVLLVCGTHEKMNFLVGVTPYQWSLPAIGSGERPIAKTIDYTGRGVGLGNGEWNCPLDLLDWRYNQLFLALCRPGHWSIRCMAYSSSCEKKVTHDQHEAGFVSVEETRSLAG